VILFFHSVVVDVMTKQNTAQNTNYALVIGSPMGEKEGSPNLVYDDFSSLSVLFDYPF